MDAKANVVCLVTIHGIGFQQPPTLAHDGDPGVDGYADDLHRHLRATLGGLLSDDPSRQRGGTGPIYVRSSDPPDPSIDASGPDRLGAWGSATGRTILTDDAPLLDGTATARIAHIALVYADLEERTPKLGSSLETLAMSALSLGHYATIGGLIHMLAQDVAALGPGGSAGEGILHWAHTVRSGQPPTAPPTSLRVRSDVGAPTGRAPYHEDVSGLLATIRQLENDVAAYVCRNDLRTRVRGFVRDALCRLAYRQDVAAIVVNSHSNGTPIAYDVLHELTPNAIGAVRALITAGSPLRKYADLFTWGTEIGNISRIRPVDGFEPWLNFWDARDPVADPLSPGKDWRPGQSPDDGPRGLFEARDATTALLTPAPIRDYPVDNLLNNHGAGLRAHNYWDNVDGFVRPLASLLEKA